MLLLTGILVGLVGRFGTPPDQLPPKQTFWDSPVVASDRAQVQSCLDSPHQLTYFLAATARHSGDWLFALLIASCGLKLDDEADKVSVAVYDLCVPHLCQYGSPVDDRGLHSLVCKQAPDRSFNQTSHAVNDLVA